MIAQVAAALAAYIALGLAIGVASSARSSRVPFALVLLWPFVGLMWVCEVVLGAAGLLERRQ